MASTLMHLAIAKNLSGSPMIGRPDRFEFGTILPDAACHEGVSHQDSHYKKTDEDGCRYLDFSEFRRRFLGKISHDDLYLGYYLHLVQDGYYRKFLYEECGLPIKNQAQIDALHRDYQLLNPYLCARYHLTDDLKIPDGFAQEPLAAFCGTASDGLLKEFRRELQEKSHGEPQIFTAAMADAYLSRCTALCMRELSCAKIGTTCLSSQQFRWKNQKQE